MNVRGEQNGDMDEQGTQWECREIVQQIIREHNEDSRGTAAKTYAHAQQVWGHSSCSPQGRLQMRHSPKGDLQQRASNDSNAE